MAFLLGFEPWGHGSRRAADEALAAVLLNGADDTMQSRLIRSGACSAGVPSDVYHKSTSCLTKAQSLILDILNLKPEGNLSSLQSDPGKPDRENREGRR